MGRLGFGISLAIVGMGGTLLSLLILSLLIEGLKRIFVPKEPKGEA